MTEERTRRRRIVLITVCGLLVVVVVAGWLTLPDLLRDLLENALVSEPSSYNG